MIRDQKINQIAHALQTGARWGMHSMEQDLQRLAAAGFSGLLPLLDCSQSDPFQDVLSRRRHRHQLQRASTE